jgi:outer membrane protein insertion porin family
MELSRPASLRSVFFCLLAAAFLIFSSAVPKSSAQQPPSEPKPTQQPKPASPFETVPQSKEQVPAPPKPESPFERPTTPEEPKPPAEMQDVVEAIEFRGARRVPQDTLRALIFTKPGDRFDEEALHRDFIALWNTGRFDDISLEREPGRTGWVVRFVVVERRVVRSIKYDGMKSITISEILDRFKERRVGLTVETQYDPNRVQRAAVVLKEYLAERGRQFATVEPQIRQIPPSSLEVVFKVEEGPKVKVGRIDIQGNTAFNDRAVRRAMRSLRPIGIPYSILFESLFSKAFDSTKLEMDKDMIRNFYQERGYFTARAVEHDMTVRDVGGGKFRIPLFYMNKPGKRADITSRGGRPPTASTDQLRRRQALPHPGNAHAPLFQMGEGDIFSTSKLRKGLEEPAQAVRRVRLHRLRARTGFDVNPGHRQDRLDADVDEGKQFFVRRIDFKAIPPPATRSSAARSCSTKGRSSTTAVGTQHPAPEPARLLRGAQGRTKRPTSAQHQHEHRRHHAAVKERGRNSVQLNGGVSGIAGSFIGFGYATNNFLGLGETLSLDCSSATASATRPSASPSPTSRPAHHSSGSRLPQRFNFDQGREVLAADRPQPHPVV